MLQSQNSTKNTYFLIISISMLIINLFLIFVLASFNRIVYVIFFYHVSSAWLSYFSFTISLISHLIYLKHREIKWSRIGKNSVIIGVVFSAVTLITGSIWFNSTSGGYNNIYWVWGEPRQTTTLVLFISYLSYLIFANSIEESDKKAKLTAILGIVLFPTVPLSYLSAILFSSIHPRINPNPNQQGYIYWDPLNIFILIFNLIAMTFLFIYIIRELIKLDEAKEKLNEIIYKKLKEE